MNELGDIKKLVDACNIPQENAARVTSGQLYRPDYTTYKFRIEAPPESMVDVDYYSLVVAAKGKKTHLYPLIKEAPRGYLTEYQKLLEQILKANSLEFLLYKLQGQYDTYLLKFYNYFYRYQSVDNTGSTCLRYYFKKEAELPDNLKTVYSEQTQKPAKENDHPGDAVESTGQMDYNDAMTTSNNTDFYNQGKADYAQKRVFDSDKVQIAYKEPRPKFRLFEEKDFKTLDQHFADIEHLKQINYQAAEEKQAYVERDEEEEAQETVPKVANRFHVEHESGWSDANSAAFKQLVQGLSQINLTQNLIRLCRRFDSFEISAADEHQISFGIDIPLRQIPFHTCANLPLFSTMFERGDYTLPFVFCINVDNPGKSILRVDPTGSILPKIIYHGRSAAADLAYSIDYCDFYFLSILSRELTGILRLAWDDLPCDTREQRDVITVDGTVVYIFQPKAKKCQAVPLDYQTPNLIDEARFTELVQQLPAQFTVIPFYLLYFSLCKNVDLIIAMFFDVAKYAAETIRRQRIQEIIQQYLDSSADADEPSEDSYSSCSTAEGEDSSSDSVYESYSAITNSFLVQFDPYQQVPQGVRLHLTGLELDNAMILQFYKVMVSCYCSKCAKMNILPLDSEIPPMRQQYSDLLTGTEVCSGCKSAMTLHLLSRLFNSASVNLSGAVEPLFVLKHINCMPISIAYFEQSSVLVQCECGTLSLQNQFRVFYSRNGQGCSARCPVCFKRLSLLYQNAFFALANGQQIKIQGQSGPQKAVKLTKATPLQGDGTCKHYPRSYRFFRFACGQAFPCDVCHEQNCDCGDEMAKTMICGFCGKSQPVSETCAKCRRNLTKQRGSHWEGGEGCRDRAKMSRKDDRKYRGAWKTRSKADRKRTAMQKRGNAKKKPEEYY